MEVKVTYSVELLLGALAEGLCAVRYRLTGLLGPGLTETGGGLDRLENLYISLEPGSDCELRRSTYRIASGCSAAWPGGDLVVSLVSSAAVRIEIEWTYSVELLLGTLTK